MPSYLAPNDAMKRAGSTTISPKAANAAPFLPKTIIQSMKPPLQPPCEQSLIVSGQTNNATPPVRQDVRTPDWGAMAEVQEFIPGRMETSLVSLAWFAL